MSRSYKKHAVFTDNGCSHANKKLASRITRRAINRGEDFQDGNWYRKWYCSWNICDYRFGYYTKRQEDESWYVEAGKRYLLRMK